MKPWKTIQKLESSRSRLFKESVIAEFLEMPLDFRVAAGLLWALDPLVTFGVKKIPVATKDGPGLDFTEFSSVVNDLISRELSGNAAKESIADLMSQATIEEWNDWYRRILLKDLKCGVSAKSINNTAKKLNIGFIIPIFGCMLAHDGAKHPKKLVGKCLVEYKYDGIRVITLIKDGKATMYSRNGKVLENFPHIIEGLEELKLDDCMIDAEVMSDNFQSLMKQVHRKKDAKTEDAYLAVFDALPLDEYLNGKGELNTLERKDYLDNLFSAVYSKVVGGQRVNSRPDECIKIVDYEQINLDTDEGQIQFSDMNKGALDEGYEGLMVKPVDGLYECKRSHSWLKVKPFIEVTLECIGLEEGTGKNKDLLGALVVEGEDDGKFFHLNVGSGLTDENRKEFWENKKKVLGQLVEIRADAITQSQEEEHFSLRFPRFKTFRGFAHGEKI